MPNPFNPLEWIKAAQNWFSTTERSSGFRPFLIFIILQIGFAIVAFSCFNDIKPLTMLVEKSLCVSFISFIVLFAIKCFQDPNFCRSEKHIENVRRIEMAEQKGDAYPIPTEEIDIISNPEIPTLPTPKTGEEK
ncbi:MAG: hypothetical protein PHT53_07715 [Candidatus Omnitrophica bacterium]|nr:hypothetical protein [Candidatus Omnitrophota bacterium]